MDNFWLLVFICNISTVLPLVLINWIPEEDPDVDDVRLLKNQPCSHFCVGILIASDFWEFLEDLHIIFVRPRRRQCNLFPATRVSFAYQSFFPFLNQLDSRGRSGRQQCNVCQKSALYTFCIGIFISSDFWEILEHPDVIFGRPRCNVVFLSSTMQYFSQELALLLFGVKLFHGCRSLRYVTWIDYTVDGCITFEVCFRFELCCYISYPMSVFGQYFSKVIFTVIFYDFSRIKVSWNILHGRRVHCIWGAFLIWGLFLLWGVLLSVLFAEFCSSKCLRIQFYCHVSTTFQELRSHEMYYMVDGCIAFEEHFWSISDLRSVLAQYFSEVTSTVISSMTFRRYRSLKNNLWSTSV